VFNRNGKQIPTNFEDLLIRPVHDPTRRGGEEIGFSVDVVKPPT
jgi:hypothetical protein